MVCQLDACENSSYSRGLCKPHYEKSYREGTLGQYHSAIRRHTLSNKDFDVLTADCSVCGSVKLFHRKTHSKYYCENSSNAKKKNYRSYSYDDGVITHSEAKVERARLEVSQQGLCNICKKPSMGKSLALDHCHRSGKIRGLLCTKCNIGLGMFEDDPERLKAAIEYLSL